MPLFAVEYTYSDATAAGRDEHRPSHREWLGRQVEDGFVVSSGPYVDGSGALILVSAADRAAVDARLADDPFATADLIDAVRVTEWLPVMGALST
ncbi:YciI family protein [Antrihabitans spumae]|uniref:YciI family protein n=1 Tax=Antrihabitans spumae TaxID=3373370 RepID=A0ABW7K8T2_9NOCA